MIEIKNFDVNKKTEVIQLWNETFPLNPITSQTFDQKILNDLNFDLNYCKLAYKDQELVGFILATKRKVPYFKKGLEKEKAWINVLFVKEKWRRLKIGQRLLENIENKLIQDGTQEIILGMYSPNYFFPGVDLNCEAACLFFEKNAYIKTSHHYSMQMDLKDFKMSDAILKKKKDLEKHGFRFISYENSYQEALLSFIQNEFSDSWAYYAQKNINASKGHRLYIVLNPNNEIIGFSNRAMDDDECRFGPIGIAKDYRNLSLGSILLECTLLKMQEEGLERMHFKSTDEAGKRYYLRNGLSLYQSFGHYEKRIK